MAGEELERCSRISRRAGHRPYKVESTKRADNEGALTL